ncbi:uncharacterized protein BJ171DRAFT_57469 [Polychytrium aggregatum]|uniref:uncharacterized protein n=1 Tax=Polychytrium aggregatum TaxID=110093 RepID=UPI0022FE33CA|nr:uncharacterized protein BJ171DRAFT_57469 [Polychytrium aggregatum]KAI9190784.1 hypothetical protein BJ171DRAFT_57469 [Polychytrium aggregatum]
MHPVFLEIAVVDHLDVSPGSRYLGPSAQSRSRWQAKTKLVLQNLSTVLETLEQHHQLCLEHAQSYRHIGQELRLFKETAQVAIDRLVLADVMFECSRRIRMISIQADCSHLPDWPSTLAEIRHCQESGTHYSGSSRAETHVTSTSGEMEAVPGCPLDDAASLESHSQIRLGILSLSPAEQLPNRSRPVVSAQQGSKRKRADLSETSITTPTMSRSKAKRTRQQSEHPGIPVGANNNSNASPDSAKPRGQPSVLRSKRTTQAMGSASSRAIVNAGAATAKQIDSVQTGATAKLHQQSHRRCRPEMHLDQRDPQPLDCPDRPQRKPQDSHQSDLSKQDASKPPPRTEQAATSGESSRDEVSEELVDSRHFNRGLTEHYSANSTPDPPEERDYAPPRIQLDGRPSVDRPDGFVIFQPTAFLDRPAHSPRDLHRHGSYSTARNSTGVNRHTLGNSSPESMRLNPRAATDADPNAYGHGLRSERIDPAGESSSQDRMALSGVVLRGTAPTSPSGSESKHGSSGDGITPSEIQSETHSLWCTGESLRDVHTHDVTTITDSMVHIASLERRRRSRHNWRSSPGDADFSLNNTQLS